MRLTLDNQEVNLTENTEISSQLNSPLTSFKLIGDKSYTYTIPVTETNNQIIKQANHLQVDSVKTEFFSNLSEANISVIAGKARLKKTNNVAITLDCVVPPGNVSTEFWNTKLRELNLGSDTLNSAMSNAYISVLNLQDKLYKQSNAAQEKTFEELLLTEGCTIVLTRGNVGFWQYAIKKPSGTKEEYKNMVLADFSYAISSYNTNRTLADVELYFIKGNLNIIYDITSGSSIFGIRIEFPARHQIYPNEKFININFKELKFENVSQDLTLSKLQTKDYFFPTIFAPNFYSDKTGDFNGYINYKENGGLRLNNEQYRTTFPIVPCFRFKFIFEKLMNLMGYNMYEAFWDDWKNLSFCSMRDFSKQHPDTDLPFNIYGKKINYADYMPDWTVIEFFDEVGYLTGSCFTFNQMEKTVKVEHYKKLFEVQPLVYKNIFKVVDTSFDEAKQYLLSYVSKIETELNTDALKAFFSDYPNYPKEDTVNKTKIQLKFLPLAPSADKKLNNLAETVSVFCHTTGQSNIFNLADETPIPRVFFYDAASRKALLETDKISLSRVGEKAITNLWKAIINARKRRQLTADTLMSILDFSQIDFLKPLQIKNVNYLVKQINIKLRNNEIYHKVQMVLEQIT